MGVFELDIISFYTFLGGVRRVHGKGSMGQGLVAVDCGRRLRDALSRQSGAA